MADGWRETAYGPVNSNFAENCLADLCCPANGIQTGPFGSQLHKKDYVPVGTPIITVEHLGQNRILHEGVPCVSEKDRLRLSKYWLRKGDIVFSRVGSVDRRALVRDGEDGWIFSGRCLRVRPNSNQIDAAFLSYFFGLPAFREHIRSIAVGATMPSLNTKILSDISVPHPESLEEQRSIAHVLGTLDDKIELNRQMNRTLEEMALALFKSWFVDFDPVHAKATLKHKHHAMTPSHGGSDWTVERARAYLDRMDSTIAALLPNSFMDSELGPIPEGWEVSEIDQFADVIDCLHSKKPARRMLGKPLLQLWNIRDDSLLDMADTYFIDDPDYEQWVSRMEAVAGDCVITNVGRVGAVAQVPVGLEAALGRNMTGIRCKKSSVFPTFLIECLRSKAMRNEISRKVDTGTILEALNVRSIPKLRFVLGTNRVLSAFEQRVRPLRARMEQNLVESFTLTALRDALLPRLVSGGLRVKDSEKIVWK